MPDAQQWERLSKRGQTSVEPEGLYEGIPSHLRRQLWAWYDRWLDDAMRDEIELRLRLDARSPDATFEQAFSNLLAEDDELFLDVIDSMLWICAERASPPPKLTMDDDFSQVENYIDYYEAPHQLEALLLKAGSAWQVAPDSRSLQRRVPGTVVAAFMAAVPRGMEASGHLGAAWQAAYGRDSDASRAYREAIRAVEAAAIPVVEPNNPKATLGTVLRTLRDQSSRWELAILGLDRQPRDIAPLLGMIELLWQGHSDRHAPVTPIPAEAAPMAVHLAVTLVQWFHSGSVRPRAPR